MNNALKVDSDSPAWKFALEMFLSRHPEPGTVLRKDWLLEHFNIEKPVTAEDQTKADLKFLRAFVSFQSELLEVYKIDLKPIIGIGYEVVHPKDQTRRALVTSLNSVGKELRKMSRKITHVNTTALTESERKEHTDGISKAASIRAMFDRRKLLKRV